MSGIQVCLFPFLIGEIRGLAMAMLMIMMSEKVQDKHFPVFGGFEKATDTHLEMCVHTDGSSPLFSLRLMSGELIDTGFLGRNQYA